MNYFWTFCPQCSGQLTIQYSEHPDGLAGSLRRWSRDRSVNDGRQLHVPRAELSPDGSFHTACICGEPIQVRAAEVQHAATERP
ncbi:MAG: hypothetical protein ABI968_05415 [Acidobacteriota bacterium]